MQMEHGKICTKWSDELSLIKTRKILLHSLIIIMSRARPPLKNKSSRNSCRNSEKMCAKDKWNFQFLVWIQMHYALGLTSAMRFNAGIDAMAAARLRYPLRAKTKKINYAIPSVGTLS